MRYLPVILASAFVVLSSTSGVMAGAELGAMASVQAPGRDAERGTSSQPYLTELRHKLNPGGNLSDSDLAILNLRLEADQQNNGS
ncbi:MAG: hypothetical protein P4L98_25210 [Ancalomicrobiaceae bacterium]|nr:hypothetical protein [Ancalomicrobiaceae bacterium]